MSEVIVQSKPKRFRLIVECDEIGELENLLEFIGRSLENGVLRAQFEWGAEAVETYTLETIDEPENNE